MRKPALSVLVRFGGLLLLLVLVDYAVRVYARENFIAPRRLATALRAGDGCLAFSGGSDMLAALDLAILERNWQGSKAPCFADLTLGGTSPDVRFMAFREYVKAGRRPSGLVIGFRGHDVMDERDLRPGYHVGNDANVYTWGTLADLSTYYPRLSFDALDNGFRFLLYRATAIGANRQAIWVKLELLQQRLGLKPREETNALGNVLAFREIEAEMITAARTSLVARDPATLRLATWHARLLHAAREAGARRVSFVRLPSSAALERAFFPDAESARVFSDFMTRLARENGGVYVDLSHAPWVNDSLVTDGLHYSPEGAARISEELGRALGN